jgi:hypothetical protein
MPFRVVGTPAFLHTEPGMKGIDEARTAEFAQTAEYVWVVIETGVISVYRHESAARWYQQRMGDDQTQVLRAWVNPRERLYTAVVQ